MLRKFLVSTTVGLPLIAASGMTPAMAQSSDGPLTEIPQGVILATSIIGMPTFIEGEAATAGPIGSLADAIVSTDGQIVGVVVRTRAGRALAVPASLLRQGRIGGAPVLVIDITREQAEGAPDVSGQLPAQEGSQEGSQGTDGATVGERSGVTGTTIDGTDATGADTGENGTGTTGRAGTDGTAMDAGTDDASMDDDPSADDGATGATAGEQSGVTGTTIDGTDATGADTSANGTGTAGRAGTDGTAMDAGTDDADMDGNTDMGGADTDDTPSTN